MLSIFATFTYVSEATLKLAYTSHTLSQLETLGRGRTWPEWKTHLTSRTVIKTAASGNACRAVLVGTTFDALLSFSPLSCDRYLRRYSAAMEQQCIDA
jgi:hypothetical protein